VTNALAGAPIGSAAHSPHSALGLKLGPTAVQQCASRRTGSTWAFLKFGSLSETKAFRKPSAGRRRPLKRGR
jgi:hypothetical protein